MTYFVERACSSLNVPPLLKVAPLKLRLKHVAVRDQRALLRRYGRHPGQRTEPGTNQSIN